MCCNVLDDKFTPVNLFFGEMCCVRVCVCVSEADQDFARSLLSTVCLFDLVCNSCCLLLWSVCVCWMLFPDAVAVEYCVSI